MCLLCYFPPNAPIESERLVNSCLNNPDGFGFSALDSVRGSFTTFHTMNADEAVARFIAERERNPETHALFHARLATAGSVSTDNCHPFQISGARAVLGHNGHFPLPLKQGEKRSDTRVFAEDVFPASLEALDTPKRLAKLEKWAGGNKVVILSADSRLAKPAYIINESLGHWDGGVWWSNDSYELWDWRKYSPFSFGYQNGSSEWDSLKPEVEEALDAGCCPNCWRPFDTGSDYSADWVCQFCSYCFDCLSADCLCYWNPKLGGSYAVG